MYTRPRSKQRPDVREGATRAGSVVTTPGGEQQPAPGTPEFLRAVRLAAGRRVSPREIEPVLEALRKTRTPVTPQRVAELVAAIHGDRSARQRRYPELWRLLGAYLSLQGKPAHPQAQLALIGRCRRLVGDEVSDVVLLTVGAEIGASGKPLDARFIARVVRWLLEQGLSGAELERLDELLPRAIEAAARAARPTRRPRSSRLRQERPSPQQRPHRRGSRPPRRR